MTGECTHCGTTAELVDQRFDYGGVIRGTSHLCAECKAGADREEFLQTGNVNEIHQRMQHDA